MDKKILIVDDHNLFIDGLKYLLSTYGINVTAVANNGYEAYDKAISIKPDIIFMDIYMPLCNGIKALKLIKGELPEVKIIMLTSSDDIKDLKEAVKLGAWGYMLKDVNGEDVVRIIHNIDNKEVVISASFASEMFKDSKKIIDKYINSDLKGKDQDLTERQIEVIDQIIKGKTYKEVGEALHISERTVKYHVGRVIKLLHLENRAQVIAYAIENKLIDR